MERDDFIVQVIRTINEAEVMTIFFPHLERALVVDTRNNPEEGPMLRLMHKVNSMEERMAQIEKLRPSLGKIHSIHGIPWTKSMRTLRENDILAHVRTRLIMCGMPKDVAERTVMQAYTKLLSVEQEQWSDMIRGTSPTYKTLWQAKSSSSSNNN